MTFQFGLAVLFIFSSTSVFAQKIRFNPEVPLYIEYQSSEKLEDMDVSIQIDDATGPAKIRLSLQAKPETISAYYGYIWLQLGKKITKEVIFKRSHTLSGWLTNQDGIQALFLFDHEKEMLDFKNKAQQSQKPLTEKSTLPELVSTTPATAPRPITIFAEVTEVVKYAKLMEAWNTLSPTQSQANKEKAAQLAQSALKQYQSKNYVSAESQFENSLELNPSIGLNLYYLGLCYYQTQKYERAIALLSLAEGAEYNYAEYKYYMGLANMKLKNYTKASENFDSAKDENDADYSAPAAFYNGHIFFQKEDYVQARQNFEYTIDYSKNSKMDTEAETMLEKISQIEGFKKQNKENFRYMLFVGFGYDSNVLNVSTENRSTNQAAYRLAYGGELYYRFLNRTTQDLSIGLNAGDYYSLDSKFKSEATVQSVDPLNYGISLPYHYRFHFTQRLFTWGLTPSYQALNMAYETTTRKKLLDMLLITTDLSFAVSEKHLSKIYLEYAQDKMQPSPALLEDDLSASRITAGTSQTWVTSMKAKESWIADLNYSLNSSDGDNNDYNKATLGLTYSRLGYWNAMNSARIDYTYAKYDHALIDRKDDIATFNLGIAKELNKELNLFVNALYTLSASTNESYKYDKFAIQSLFTYSGAF